MGPGGIQKASYPAESLSQAQRQWLWGQFGHSGEAPVGYGGEGGAGVTGGGGGGGAQTPNYADIAQQMLKMRQEANVPAVQSLQAQMPEIGQKFGVERQRILSEQQPLEQRYQNLLTEVTRRQQEEEQRTGLTTSQELGRRGITSSSGLYSQEINKKLSPVTQFYTGQAANIGLGKEESMRNIQNLLANLPVQQTEAERQIANAIAQLQAGGAGEAITQALSMFNLQQQAQQQAATLSESQRSAQALEQYRQQELAFKQQQWPTEQALQQAQIARYLQLAGGGGGGGGASSYVNPLQGQVGWDIVGY